MYHVMNNYSLINCIYPGINIPQKYEYPVHFNDNHLKWLVGATINQPTNHYMERSVSLFFFVFEQKTKNK